MFDDDEENDLITVLYDSLSLVLGKFYETYGEVYSEDKISEAVSNVIFLISQAHLSYICQIGSSVDENKIKNEIYKQLKDVLNWQHKSDFDILETHFSNMGVDPEDKH